MAESPREPGFRSTHWSLVEQARGADPEARREALGSLVALYWPALRAHLVIKRRLTPEAADDLLQGFAVDRVLAERFLGHVDRSKGRFRSFMLRCLENYWIDHCRGRREASSLDEAREVQLPARQTESPDVFDVAWAKQVLNAALRRMWDNCQSQRQAAIWGVFYQRVLRPTLHDAAAPSYDQIAAQFGFASEQQAANALVTAKRQFRRALEDVVGDYVKNKTDLQQEIIELRVILSIAEPGDTSPTAIPGPPSDRPEEDSSLPIGGFDESALPGVLHESKPSLLARLFGVEESREAVWEPFDYENMLSRLLKAPLADALPGIDHRTIAAAVQSLPDATPATLTLFGVFADSAPPIDLLRAIKDWSRRSTRSKDSPLPLDVASLLYFASIAAAQVRRGEWISKLDPAIFHRGVEMFLAESWVGEPVR
ncbi:MAG TPA: sigma-70 family RNA polymerase sigma factor, partial [Pirellulales bacterium]|nr:sigma-70 family RNA polymerase sigma factor [Pirellulales bacterium]